MKIFRIFKKVINFIMKDMENWRIALLTERQSLAEVIERKSGKNQNSWGKRKLQVLENIGSRHYQTNRNERKKKVYHRRIRKLLKNKLCYRNLIKGIDI